MDAKVTEARAQRPNRLQNNRYHHNGTGIMDARVTHAKSDTRIKDTRITGAKLFDASVLDARVTDARVTDTPMRQLRRCQTTYKYKYAQGITE